MHAAPKVNKSGKEHICDHERNIYVIHFTTTLSKYVYYVGHQIGQIKGTSQTGHWIQKASIWLTSIKKARIKWVFVLGCAKFHMQLTIGNIYLIVFIHVSSWQHSAFTILLMVCIIVSHLNVLGRDLRHMLGRYLLHVSSRKNLYDQKQTCVIFVIQL